jgi:hypothetical protein
MGGSSVPGRGPDGGHAEHDGLPGGADRGYCPLDLRPVLLAEGFQIGFDPADQFPDLTDLLVGPVGLCACLRLEIGRGAQALAVGQQLLQGRTSARAGRTGRCRSARTRCTCTCRGKRGRLL